MYTPETELERTHRAGAAEAEMRDKVGRLRDELDAINNNDGFDVCDFTPHELVLWEVKGVFGPKVWRFVAPDYDIPDPSDESSGYPWHD